MEQKEAKVVLTIDYGTKKIGVCISETLTGHSKALPSSFQAPAASFETLAGSFEVPAASRQF